MPGYVRHTENCRYTHESTIGQVTSKNFKEGDEGAADAVMTKAGEIEARDDGQILWRSGWNGR